MTDTRTRRRGARAVAVLAGLLAAAAAAEAALRVTHWGVWAPRTDDYNLLRPDGASYWIFDLAQPTKQSWDGDPYGHLPPGARMTYVLNSHGTRGPEPLYGRPKVLFVGDSFTFGEGVQEPDTFAARVERSLAARMNPPPQSINSGVPGYGSQHEAERLPSLLHEFEPRVVVLVFVPNDPIPLDEDENHAGNLLKIGEDAKPALYLARLASNVLGGSARDREIEAWYLSYYTGEREERWERSRKDLAKMKADCAAAGAKFGVVLFPLIHRLKERPFAAIDEAVAGACRDMRVPFIDLSDALAREPEQALWVHPTDHHPDARAHEIAAEQMTPFVESLLR